MPFEHVEGDDQPLPFLERLGCILVMGSPLILFVVVTVGLLSLAFYFHNDMMLSSQKACSDRGYDTVEIHYKIYLCERPDGSLIRVPGMKYE